MKAPRLRRAMIWVVVGLTFLGVEAVVFLLPAEHHGGPWNGIPFWDLVFGFGAAAALFQWGGRVLKPLLGRSEDYYAGTDDP